jgi:hypothetical protein
MKKYSKCDDFKDRNSEFKAFGINEFDDDSILYNKTHAQKIEVYGDIKLRNRIIKLLNKYEKEEKDKWKS